MNDLVELPPPAPHLSRREREFLPEELEVLETPPSPVALVLAGFVLIAAAAAVAWSLIGRLDIHATLAGKIIPAGKVKVVEPLITGSIAGIAVREGEQVARGQLLARIEPTEQAADLKRLAHRLAGLRLGRERLKTTLHGLENPDGTIPALTTPSDRETPGDSTPRDNVPELLALQQALLKQTLTAHRSERYTISSQVAQREAELERVRHEIRDLAPAVAVLAEQRVIFAKLFDQKFGSKLRLLQAHQAWLEGRARLTERTGRAREIEAAIATLQAKLVERTEAAMRDVISELAETEQTIAGLEQDLLKARAKERHTRLVAPVAGTVQHLAVHTVGDVVQTGERLMIVVPDGTTLEVEAMLPNKDKGFVHAGQSARIKVEAFPFTRYGLIEGTVRSVSNDAVALDEGLVFPVRIAVKRDTIMAHGRHMKLTPGMAVTAEIRTGDRRIIDYLLSPLARYADEAMRER